MNTIRLIAIALPMTLLLACGGGGGGGTAAAPTIPNTPPHSTGDGNPLAGLDGFMPTTNSSTIRDIQEITGMHNQRFDFRIYEAGVALACNLVFCPLFVLSIISNSQFYNLP